MSHIYILCIYVPPVPSLRQDHRNDVLQFLVEAVDKLTNMSPKSEVVICGDFNRFPVQDLCNVCNLTGMFVGNTYNERQLDHILMSEALSEHYKVTAEASFDNSKIYTSRLFDGYTQML